MLSAAEARAHIVAAFTRLPAEDIPLSEALGRTLAEPVVATRDQPPFAASAMDGYAFRAAPTSRNYTIVGEAAAGHAFSRPLGEGEAIRISTGAPLPEGADAVLRQEHARIEADRLIAAHVQAGADIRPRAIDVAKGARLCDRGALLDPVTLALVASAGVATVSVVRKPRIAVFATGDEVVAPGASARDDQVYESGAFAVRGLIARWGGLPVRGAVLPDDRAAIEHAAAAAFEHADLLVLIGGASVGPHDHARPALEGLGVALAFDKVAIRPGKPTWFGAGAPGKVLGLPGNPGAAIVCALLFLKPAIEAMLGKAATTPFLRHAPLADALPENGPYEAYLRARFDPAGALAPLREQDPASLTGLANAQALIVRAPNAPASEPGHIASYLPAPGAIDD